MKENTYTRMHACMHARIHSLLSEMQDNQLPNKELFVWVLFPGLEAFIYKCLVQLMSNTLVNCTSEVWPKTHTARSNFQRPLLLSFWSVDWLALMAFLSASDHCLPHSPYTVCLAIKTEWTSLHVSVFMKDLWISVHQIQTFTWIVIPTADKEHKHFRILLLRKAKGETKTI